VIRTRAAIRVSFSKEEAESLASKNQEQVIYRSLAGDFHHQ